MTAFLKSLHPILIFWMVSGAVSFGEIQPEILDPQRLAYVEELVVSYPNDSPAPVDAEQAAKEEIERKVRVDEIRAGNNIKPYLFALLDKHYKGEPSSGISSIFDAISIRDDLDDLDMMGISAEMRRILEAPFSGTAEQENLYLAGGVKVLRRKRSQENEDLAIAVLNRSDDLRSIKMKIEACETLSVIGTEKSLSHLFAASKWLQSMPGKGPVLSLCYDRVSEANLHLIRRLEGKATSVSSDRAETDRRRTRGEVTGSQVSRGTNLRSGVYRFWPEILAFAFVILVGIVALRKTRVK